MKPDVASPQDSWRIQLPGVFIRRTDWGGANLTAADLSGADASNANFSNVNFKDAVLEGTILLGADLTGARNLTHEQLAKAVIDEATKLPSYIDRTKISSTDDR